LSNAPFSPRGPSAATLQVIWACLAHFVESLGVGARQMNLISIRDSGVFTKVASAAGLTVR
jgi:hypothetical protein